MYVKMQGQRQYIHLHSEITAKWSFISAKGVESNVLNRSYLGPI